jgi:hypothetical protein
MLKITDANNFRRTVVGLCLIAAPLFLLLASLNEPNPGGGAAGLVQAIAEHPGQAQAHSLAFIISSIFFVPALIGLLYLIRDRGVVLGHIGVGLALIGAVGRAVWLGFQIVLLGFIQSGIDREQLSAVVEGGPPNVGFVTVLLMSAGGTFLGMIILAIGLWRGRVAPLWVAVCIIAAIVWVSTPPLFMIMPQVDVGGALLLVGLGWIGLKVLRMSDADWERGTLPSSKEVGVGAQLRVQ